MLNTKRTPKGTLVTIVKYEDYQVCDTTDDTTVETTLETPNETTDEPQKKNIKNINNNICSNSLSDDEQKSNKKSQQDELENNFKIIYESYPKKVGKARGFDLYKGWLKGRDVSGRKVKLTNKQIWDAIAKYKHQLDEDGTEKQYIKQFDTFMCKAILDYVEDEQ